MNKLYGVIKVSLCLVILFSFLQCNTKTASNCNSKKIQLLLEDFLKKEKCFLVMKIIHESIDKDVIVPKDSTVYFGYLHSPNLKIPDKEFYLHWNKEYEPYYPDSIKLKVIKNLSEMNALAFVVGVDLSEVNEDSTKLKLSFNSGMGRVFDRVGSFSYYFNEKECKWIVLDSTISLSITK